MLAVIESGVNEFHLLFIIRKSLLSVTSIIFLIIIDFSLLFYYLFVVK